MRYPIHTRDTPRPSQPLLAAMAAVAVGMFIGTWVIGPALTHGSSGTPAAKEERTSYDAMIALPDPSPYRTPTPVFDTSAQPGYGTAAREKARAELGGRRTAVEDSTTDFPPQAEDDRPRAQYRYPAPDRHAIH